MGKIDYKAIYEQNQDEWKALTRDPQKYEALLAGHYSDSNHFVYELLQNAEDAFDRKTGLSADKVVIEYYEDKLIFYHNGKPFDEADARGVSSMLMGTKDRDDAQTIGRFGMGFKSVFKYTYQPEIYSDQEAFKITNYLLPVEITDGWDFEREKQSIVCKNGDNSTFRPFIGEDHLTKIVIPFQKYGRDGVLEAVPGDDVLKKLDELNGEILLFLTHIRSLYWVNKETGRYAKITLKQDKEDEKLITCRIEGTDYGEKEEITRYLKFKKVFDHPDMDNAEVSVAYKLNSRADNINEVDNSSVWVYFPTRDDTDLPFLIHGSFETAVSREKLMTPSSFNNDLFNELADLISESMVELAKRKLITQVFIRRSLLAAFEDEEENETIPGLKGKITDVIRYKGLLPDRTGTYRRPDEMQIPVPFRMADFADRPLIKRILQDKVFVAFNNEREAKFSEYYNWLVDDLNMKVYGLCDLALDLQSFDGLKIQSSSEEYESLLDFYDFLSDNRESIYETGLSYSRSGPYESRIRRDLKDGWRLLRREPIILNRLNQLVPAEDDDKPCVYLGASSEYKSVMQSALVNKSIAERFKDVLTDGFRIQEFNNFQYIKEKVIQKYIDIDEKIAFEDRDNYTTEYIEDINQILSLIDETGNVSEIQSMLKDAWIIKTKPMSDDDNGSFARPGDCYAPFSEEGIDLGVYYAPIPFAGVEGEDLLNDDNWYDFEFFAIDKDFYESNGIAISKLSKLGLITSPVTEGTRSNTTGVGDNYWVALGEFCPELRIEGLQDNLNYIEGRPDDDLAKEKSVVILKLLLSIAEKLKGKRRRRQRNPYDGEVEEARVLAITIKHTSWLFDKEMNVCTPRKMSRFDLNPALYGNIIADKGKYEILGFIEKEADETEETFQKAAGLTRKDKKLLVNQLARELGLQISEPSQGEDWPEEGEGGEEFFNPNAWQDNEFPINRISNIDYLIRHVQEQFYCADPTTYRKVLRQIRVSKNTQADRAYAIGMYTNSGNVHICQMCKKPIAYIEVDQIANFGIELPQLNLCLCRDCSTKYRAIRDRNKDEFKSQIRSAFMQLDVSENAEEYSIEFNSDTSLHFTQTHIAEVQEIFRLLSEYGTPSSNADDYNDVDVTGPLMHPVMDEEKRERIRRHLVGAESNNNLTEQSHKSPEEYNYSDIQEDTTAPIDEDTARTGSFVSYKKKNTDEIKEIMHLEPSKYPLHEALEGHKAGETIRFMTFYYEIISVVNE